MDLILIVIPIVLIAASGIILWQIWGFLHSDKIPEDEPLGEERAKYLTDRLEWFQYLLVAEVVIFLIKTVLDFFELFQ